MQHGCVFKVKVINNRAVRSPLTKGGLEITALVTVIWSAYSAQKFAILKNYIVNNYNSLTNDEDDSEDILKDIIKEIEDLKIHEDSSSESEENH